MFYTWQKKPVDRSCVQGITRSMLHDCNILPLAHVYTWVCPASWEGQSSLFCFFFLPHAAFWNICEVIIPMHMLCCLELLAVLSWEEHCWFPTGPNRAAFSLWESDLCFFISPKLDAILILQSLYFTDLDSDFHACCCGEGEKKKSMDLLHDCKSCFLFGGTIQRHLYRGFTALRGR